MRLQKDTETVAYDSDMWQIPESPVRSVESDTLLKVTWTGAERLDKRGRAVVYTLLWSYDQIDTWSPVCTVSHLSLLLYCRVSLYELYITDIECLMF